MVIFTLDKFYVGLKGTRVDGETERVSVAGIKRHDQKQLQGGAGVGMLIRLFHLQLTGYTASQREIRLGDQGRKLEAEPASEPPLSRAVLLAGSSGRMLSLPGVGTILNGLGTSH